MVGVEVDLQKAPIALRRAAPCVPVGSPAAHGLFESAKMDDVLLTEKAAATLLAVEPGWLRRQRVAGRIAFVRVGPRYVRYRRSDVVRLVQLSRVGGRAAEQFPAETKAGA